MILQLTLRMKASKNRQLYNIENCELADTPSARLQIEFKCPLTWNNLASGSNDKERYCAQCEKTGLSFCRNITPQFITAIT